MIEGKVSGAPLVRGTRIPADFVIESFELAGSVEEVVQEFPSIPMETLRGVLTYGVARLAWDEETLVDWRGCDLVEQVPGRCSGAPTVVGSRIFPDTIAKYYWSGANVDDVLEDYPSLSREQVSGLFSHLKRPDVFAA